MTHPHLQAVEISGFGIDSLVRPIMLPDGLADPIVFGQDGPSAPAIIPAVNDDAPLRKQIGKSKCRITQEEALKRLDYVMEHIPQNIWPSTAALAGRYKGEAAIIAGGGPSLASTYWDMRKQRLAGNAKIFAPNKSHDWLVNGARKPNNPKRWKRLPLTPDFGVLADPSDFVVTYQTPHRRVTYLLATIVDRGVLVKFLKAGARAFMWVPVYAEDGADIALAAEKHDKAMHFVSGGSTIGLRTINLAVSMGFEWADLYGFDSCYAPGDGTTLYSYDKPVIVHDVVDSAIRCREDGTTFRYRTNAMMAKQAMEFDDMLARLAHLTSNGVPAQIKIRVHGDGLIPWLAWKASRVNPLVCHSHPEQMADKYGDWSYDYVEGRRM